MTRKLEEELDLPPYTKYESDDLPEEPTEVSSGMTLTEKLDHSLSLVSNLDKHDTEMDEISNKALETYDDLIDLARAVPPQTSSKIYEAAASLLKTALDARDAKSNKKLKLLDLQIKKLKSDREFGQSSENNNGIEFDRNFLISKIREATVTEVTTENEDNTDK